MCLLKKPFARHYDNPVHQRNGYARQLMETAERLLKKRGCPKINLQVRATNVGVIEFYAALGYGDDHVVGLGKRLVNDT